MDGRAGGVPFQLGEVEGLSHDPLAGEGRIDAVTTAKAPSEGFKKGGPVRRLVENYPEVEADYHRRTGIYPGFHVVAARRSFAPASSARSFLDSVSVGLRDSAAR